jgi:hypothetical protein
MIGALTALLVAAAVVAIFATTRAGQAFITRVGLHRFQQGAASDEDRAFLLRACGGDASLVEARLDAIRTQYPEWTEEQLYRRAIRAYMNANPPDLDATGPEQEVTER